MTGLLSEVDAGPAKAPQMDSLWSILQYGMDFNPGKAAIIAPSQPADHLQGLVGPATSSADYSTSRSAQARRVAARFTSAASGVYFRALGAAPTPAAASDCLSWSFAQLRRGATRLESVLSENQIMPGATVLVLIPSCAEAALMAWVSALRGYTLATMDTIVLEPGHEQELQRYIEKLAPSVVVVENQDQATAVDSCRRRHENSDNSKGPPFMGISLGPLATEPPQGWTSMLDISVKSFPDNVEAEPAPADPDRVAMIIFTSGTSGTPKGCLRTVRDLLGPLAPSNPAPPLKPPLALVHTRNFLSLAIGILYSTWYTGNTAVLAGREFSAAKTISTIVTCGPLGVAIDPAMVELILGHAEYSREKVRSVRYAQLVGSVVTVERLKRAQEAFPNARVCTAYGMTEAAGMFGWPEGPPKLHAIPSFRGVAASGVALPGLKLKIVDEKGHVVGRNVPGVLHVSGDVVTKGYLDDVAIEAFYEETGRRWYITGDCAVLDDGGRIYILGRMDNMIKSKESNDSVVIAPATIEDLLMKHVQPTVVVVGIATPGHEEMMPHAIFGKPIHQSPAEVEELVVKELGSGYRLGGVMDLQQLGLKDWPFTRLGKISIVDIKREVIFITSR